MVDDPDQLGDRVTASFCLFGNIPVRFLTTGPDHRQRIEDMIDQIRLEHKSRFKALPPNAGT